MVGLTLSSGSSLDRNLELAPVKSSTIAALGYDAARLWLDVVFVDGLRYRYLAVPRHLHEALMSASSKGTFFNRQIKGRFLYTVIETPDAPRGPVGWQFRQPR